jgi:hypothetical protein
MKHDEDNKLKFCVSYKGADRMYHVECYVVGYDLTFEKYEDAYHHAKLAEYEFNLIRKKHKRGETE